jgi:thioredoxin reductase (NADPH)
LSADRLDVAVVGEGIAGLTAAGHACALGARTASFEGNVFGGLVLNVANLHGYGDGASGIDVAAALSESNAQAGIESIAGDVIAVLPDGDGFVLRTSGREHRARRVILATGARPRTLGLPHEERLDHRGVSHCADCDGPLFAGKVVAVVGGGDAAFMQAARLAEIVGEVHLLVRGAAPRARAEFRAAVDAAPNVRIHAHAHVTALEGEDTLEAVHVAVDGAPRRLELPGLFIYIGAQPASGLAAGLTATDAAGAIVADEQGITSRPGLYAVGAVRSGYSGRLEDAEAEAKRCAAHAVASLRNE